MFMRTAAPAESPLPWDDRPGHTHRDSIGGLRLDATAVARFDRLLHEIHPEARHVDADRIATLGRWLQDLPAEKARAVLDERLSRIEQLRAMLDDADWDRREGACRRVRKLLAYLDQDQDLIPDAIPLLGLLDDVILLELAWPAVSTEAALSEELGTSQVWLLNDLEANAHGIATLGPSDLHMLRGFAPGLIGNAAVISPGTGLGEAGLFWDGSRHQPFACEGGHCDLAPADEQQIGLLRHLIGKYGHASWERVLSGPGFVELYDYLKDVARIAAATQASFAPPGPDRAATIAQAGLAEACPVASAALDWFVTLLGAEAGNLALKLNATAGVFLGGGIPPKILPRLRGPRFVEAFLAKGRMRRVLEPVPVAVVLDDRTALKGSARYAALHAVAAVEERA